MLAAVAALPLQWLHMVDATHGYAVRGQYPGYHLAVTSDAGRTWSDITPGSGTIHPSGSATIAGSTILFGTKRGPHTFAVERSDDGGRTWRMSQTFVDPHGLGIGTPDVVDPRHLFVAVGEGAAAGSEGESLWASSDGGGSWHFVSQTALPTTAKQKPGQLPFGCDKNGYGFVTASIGWATGFCAGGRPFVYRTANGGRTWRKASVPGLRSCQCNVLPPQFSGANLGAIAVTGSIARTYWTHDGGARWREAVPPVGSLVDDVVALPWAAAWLTTKTGLVRTGNAGATWQTAALPFDGGRYRLDALDAYTAFAYQGRTILETADGGAHWQGLRAVPACPVEQPNAAHPRRATPLVPPGARSLVLCRYGGLNTKGAVGGLVASARTTGNVVVQLTNELDALPALPSGIHCPFDDGSSIVARFGSSSVRIGLTGCNAVTNGRVTRRATPPVLRQLERILAPRAAFRRCAPTQLGVSVKPQGENTSAWIGTTVQNLGGPCIAKRIPVMVKVPGSRLTLYANGRLDHGGTKLLVADWSNWCGSRLGIRVVVEAGAAVAGAPVRPLPLCLRLGQPSRLSAVH